MYSDELVHHGILGQKWGVRRFQNKDGSLTSAGKVRRKTESTPEKPKKSGVGKKVLKAGLYITANILLAYGAYKITSNSKVTGTIYKASLKRSMADLDPFAGYEIVKKTPISSLK